jgi:uncharacterized protein (DUF305 family)
MNEKMRGMSVVYRVFVFAVLGVLALVTISAAQEDPAARLRGLSGAAFEVAFMQEMIVHHEMAVEMARVARQQATRAELKTMAESIIGEQGKEIDQMATWLREWHGAQRKPMDHAVMQEMDREMAALKEADGEEFDRRFAEAMIAHHQAAIDMAGLVTERAEQAELKTLAEAIISAQSREIDQMRRWLEAWGPPAAAAQQPPVRRTPWVWPAVALGVVIVIAAWLRRRRPAASRPG